MSESMMLIGVLGIYVSIMVGCCVAWWQITLSLYIWFNEKVK